MDQAQLNWITNFIWGIADDCLCDVFVRGKYRDVILPMTVLRRLGAVLEPTKQAVLEMKAALDKEKITNQDDALRSASGDEAIRAEIVAVLGAAFPEKWNATLPALEKLLADWSDRSDESEPADESEPPKKGIPDSRKKKLLSEATWKRDAALVATATRLREVLGEGLFEDHNLFLAKLDSALKKLDLKPSASDLKLIVGAVSWRVEEAAPVIKKVHKPGKAKADPLNGLFEARIGGKTCVVEYEPDSELRDFEQIPCWRRAGFRPSSVAKSCPTRPMPGSLRPTPRSATKSASPATSISLPSSVPWPRSAPTFSSWSRRPKACFTRSRRGG